MVVTVSDIINCLNDIAPFSTAESWDNVGLLVGDRRRTVSSLLVALDPTTRLLEEAASIGADTVVTHHPVIFRPLPTIDTGEPTGRFLELALADRLNIIACHTNLDSAEQGVSDALAARLGLTDVEPLLPTRQDAATIGLGRIGRFAEPIAGNLFINLLLDKLNLPTCAVAGPLPAHIQTVALCGGSGAEFAEIARQRGADVYVSAETKHHIARWAEECGFCIVDATHFATEQPIVPLLAARIRCYANARDWQLTVHQTATEKSPFITIAKNSTTNPNPTGEAS